MSDKVWKAFERVTAGFFGAVRVPLSGSNSRHGTSSDSLHPEIYMEAKRDKKYLGKTLLGLLHDTVMKAKKEKKHPVVCLKEYGKRGFWIIVHSDHIVPVAIECAMAETPSKEVLRAQEKSG